MDSGDTGSFLRHKPWLSSFIIYIEKHRKGDHWRKKILLLRVKREKPTRCNQSDIYYQTSISACFGHHYAHHQENKTMYYRMWCSARVVLAVIVWSWVASCVHCVEVTVRFPHRAHSLRPSSTQSQPAQPVQNTTCGNTWSCSPDDGHNDARNMLR